MDWKKCDLVMRCFDQRRVWVVGMISITDIVKAIIKEQQFTIEQLENYIAG